MPTGAYELVDGTVERFSCAAGPAGWRYAGSTDRSRVDVTLDGCGPVRVPSRSSGPRRRRG